MSRQVRRLKKGRWALIKKSAGEEGQWTEGNEQIKEPKTWPALGQSEKKKNETNLTVEDASPTR